MKRSPLPPEKPDVPNLYQCNLITLEDTSSNIFKNEGAGHNGTGEPVGILVDFELRVSGYSLKPTEYKSIVLCSKSYIFMVKS